MDSTDPAGETWLPFQVSLQLDDFRFHPNTSNQESPAFLAGLAS
jgi:hypothetical protein